MSHSIEVNISRRDAYPIYFGNDIWDDWLNFVEGRYANRKIVVLIDEKVHRLHGAEVERQCAHYFKSSHLRAIPEGEQSKSISQWKQLLDELLELGIERRTPLLAVGGGVTGDLAGFVAASALRGIPLLHMPTSLLAMVDSSVGGKTGVNHRTGKNIIGAFYQPEAVFIDRAFLATLERAEWIGGLAEMLKYAAISDPRMFEALREAVKAGFTTSARWLELIEQSVRIKAKIVQHDERETGNRAFLNFGHTVAHALEKYAGFGNISHGEAVFTGMLAGVYYSRQRGGEVDCGQFQFFKSLYDINLPPDDCIPELIAAMRFDKKVKDEKIRLVLLKEWGKPYVETSEDEQLIAKAWQAAFKEMEH